MTYKALKHFTILFYLTTTLAQYDPYGPIQGRNDDRNQYNQTGQPNQYGPGGTYDRDRQYDRDRPGYDNRDKYYQYDRNRSDPYGQGQYDNRYGAGGTNQPGPYDRDRFSPYGSNRNDPYGPQGDRNRTDQYGQYDRDRYGGGQGQYDQNRDRYGQGQYGGQGGQGGQYDRNRFGQRNYGQNYGGIGAGGESIGDANCCDDYCYRADRDPYLKFGTKTAYQFVYGKNLNQYTVPECRPVQFWSLNTHGTNLPDQPTIERLTRMSKIRDDIMRNYEIEGSYPVRGRLCQEDFELLKNWRWNDSISYNSANSLASQGQDDIKLLIRRYQSRFRDLLNMPYSESHFTFRYSNMDRVHDSYEALLEGLFQTNIFNVHAKVDDNMGGFDNCNSYGGSNVYGQSNYGSSQGGYSQGGYGQSGYSQSGYSQGGQSQGAYSQSGYNQNNQYGQSNTYNQNQNQNYNNQPNTYNQNYPNTQYGQSNQNTQYGQGNIYGGQNTQNTYEYFAFKDRPEYKDLARHVFRRLGYRYVLNDSIIEDMYDLCRYEKAWYINRPSPWCAAFTKKDLEVLEYAQDLKEYYANGYGNEEQSIRQACRTVRNLLDVFQNSANGVTSQEKVTITFTNPAKLENVIVALGALKDYSPLTSSNYYTQARRKWRTSDIAPFAGNLVAVLYECDQNARDRYKVMFFLNENAVEFNDCSVGLCSWDTIRGKLQDLLYRCDSCSGAAGNFVPHVVYSLSVIVAVAFYKLLL